MSYNRSDESKTVRKIVLIIIGIIILIAAGGTAGGYYYFKSGLKARNPDSKKNIVVNIPSGTSASAIGKILEDHDVIKSSLVFQLYSKFGHKDDFQAGTYRFSPAMNVKTLMNRMQNGDVYYPLKLVVHEGDWMKDIAASVAKETDISSREFLARMQNRSYIKSHYMANYAFLTDVILNKNIKYPLEGYLFPATYVFKKKDPSLDTIITRMLNKSSKVYSKYQSDLQNSPLATYHKVLTMASLLEEEAVSGQDRRKIAGVFYNRLKSHMKLQTDPTVKYAKQSHELTISKSDLEKKSSYNTYTNKGLPPGPIGNPGELSIQAALNPAKTQALYFYARPNGKVLYSNTLQEHHAHVNKYRSEWQSYRKKKDGK